jgi:hypothetical protein
VQLLVSVCRDQIANERALALARLECADSDVLEQSLVEHDTEPNELGPISA